MAISDFDTTNLKISIEHFAKNFEELLSYIYNKSKENVFLKNNWKEFCLKVSHGLLFVEAMNHKLSKLPNTVSVRNCLFLAYDISQMFGFGCLLIWEIYKTLYTSWLKFLVEPSIIHKGIYLQEELLEELKTKKVFHNPSQIKSDTHEIARRVAKNATQFDAYVSYMLIGVLSDIKNIVYLSYGQDRYVSIEKKKFDPENKLDFELLAKATEVLTVWRAQYAHYGDYLFACADLSKTSIEKYPEFNDFRSEILEGMSKQPDQFVRYIDRLFWEMGEVVRIQTESYKSINTLTKL